MDQQTIIAIVNANIAQASPIRRLNIVGDRYIQPLPPHNSGRTTKRSPIEEDWSIIVD